MNVRTWRLCGANRWGAALPTGDDGDDGVIHVTAEDLHADGARVLLASAPGGPRDPAASPASAGGLTLPPNMAVWRDTIVVASGGTRRLRRFVEEDGAFRDWYVLPPLGSSLLLAAVRNALIIADTDGRRLLALHPATGAITAEALLPVHTAVRDVETAGDRRVAVLAETAGSHTLWWWEPGRTDMSHGRRLPPVPGHGLTPRRLARDRNGALAIIAFPERASDSIDARVLFLHGDAHTPWQWHTLESVRGRFAPLPIAVEADAARGWRFRVPPPDTAIVPWPAPAGWPVFGPDGERLEIAPDSWAGLPPFLQRGTLTIGPLDAARRRSTWDRIELELDRFPGGTALAVRTRTAEDARIDENEAPWSQPHRIVGADSADMDARAHDFAVLSAPGRYLWLKLELEGAAATPELHSVALRFPRAGLIDYLPAVFREADEESRFLERFIGALEATWQPLERAVEDVARDVVPETSHTPRMLEYVASWLDQPIDESWDVATRRRSVRHAAESLHDRGTPEGFQRALRQHLAASQGRPAAELGAVPFVWEHFRSRPVQRAGAESELTLFGSEVMQRLRLGTSPLGQGVLRELGSPETDHVTLHAHRFSVFVPRALLPTEEDLTELRRTVERERPAHAEGDVVVLDARMRVGAQASLGVDTYLGVYPEARLAASAEESWDSPHARLDYDCLLAGEEPDTQPGPALGTRGGELPWRIR